MKKLSPVQAEIMKLLRDGWQIGVSNGFYVHTWIQKGGAGSGGETRKISLATINRLRSDGFIIPAKDEDSRVMKYNAAPGKS